MIEQSINDILLTDSKKYEMRWYAIHTVSGSEKRIKQMIIDQINKQKMSEFFEDIVVPVYGVPEVKRGKNVNTEKKFMPSYILIKMYMNDKVWHLVKNIPGVTGFLGSKTTPTALPESEVQRVFNKVESEAKEAKDFNLFEIGELVIVTEGPFETFTGMVEEVDNEKNKLWVSISIFGNKATPTELSFTQVRKNN
ncbi:transcription termination/antitermination protein NusG [Rickettsia endosymbiont of Halotydeus destructor]|uniref:transcription termination/antitermination protein NusG n=1 Tax=Rickettsia endosymbiont of Halotydeus destructor TaxID=2996754 RepID=UPI003BAF8B2E